MKNSAKNSPMKGKFILLAALVIAAAAAAMAVYLPRYKAEREGAGLPIAIDREKGEIVVPAEVNGKYFRNPPSWRGLCRRLKRREVRPARPG